MATKTQRAAQKRRGARAKARLETIRKKLHDLIAWAETLPGTVDGIPPTNDAENLLYKLYDAKQAIDEAAEFYCTYL